MENIEIKEILSTQIEQYKMFLHIALQNDAETILITPKDNWDAPFPTKDRNDNFTFGAYAKKTVSAQKYLSKTNDLRSALLFVGN